MSGRVYTPFLTAKLALHCNRRCDNCDSMSPWLTKGFISLDSFSSDLEILARTIKVGRLFLNGGEPFLNKELIDILYAVRESEICSKLTLISNGDLLQRAPDELWKLVDSVNVSKYPDSDYKWDKNELSLKAKKSGCRLNVNVVNKFDTIWINNRIGNAGLVNLVWETCSLKDCCLEMRDGYLYRCAPHSFYLDRMKLLGDESAFDHDRLNFRDSVDLRTEFSAFMDRKTPLKACEKCLGSIGISEQVIQLDRNQLAERMGRDQSNIMDLIDWARLGKILKAKPSRNSFLKKIKQSILSIRA